jgi:hypothetical protein
MNFHSLTVWIRNDLTQRQIRWGLLIAYGLQLLMLGLFVFDVIPQEYHREGYPLWFHNGGDNYGYFNQATTLITGNLQPSKYPLGYPLLLVPFMLVFNPTHDTLLQMMAAFWGLVMFPVGQWLLFRLSRRLTGRATWALFSVYLWTALPLLSYIALRVVSNAVVAEVGSIRMTWALMLSDGPATLFTLIVMLVFFQARDRQYRLSWVFGLGALCGFLLLIRLTTVLTLGVIVLLLLSERQWRALLFLLMAALLLFLPQLIYNWNFFGSPFTTGYTVLDKPLEEGLFNVVYLTRSLTAGWRRLGLLFPLFLVVLLGLGSVGLAYLWQQFRLGAWAVGLWIASYAALFGIYFHSWNGGIVRFLLPMYPALVIVAAGTVACILECGWQTRPVIESAPEN